MKGWKPILILIVMQNLVCVELKKSEKMELKSIKKDMIYNKFIGKKRVKIVFIKLKTNKFLNCTDMIIKILLKYFH